MVKKKNLLKTGCLLLVLAMSMASLSGCGNKNEDVITTSAGKAEQVSGSSGIESEYLGKCYSAEYTDLYKGNENTYVELYGNYHGKILYRVSDYSNGEEAFYLFDLNTKESEKLDIKFTEDSDKQYIMNVSANKADQLAVLINEASGTSEEQSDVNYKINLYNADAGFEKTIDLKEIQNEYPEDDRYVSNLILLDNNCLAFSIGSDVIILDEDGNEKGKVNSSFDFINSMSLNNEGKILLTGYGMKGLETLIVNPDSLSSEGKYDNFPMAYNAAPCSTKDGMMIVASDNQLNLYDPASQKQDLILNYIDCEIIGNNINRIFVTDEGQIVLFLQDWSSNTSEMVYLKEIDPAQVVQKEEITFGTLFGIDSDVEKAIVNFNKKNEKYRIKVVTYANEDNIQSEDDAIQALSSMNNSLITDSCPDIIDLSYVNRDNLVQKNVLLDLNEFFDYSSKYDKNDYLPNILDVYTVNGVLTSIPKNIHLNVILGGKSVLGDVNSWTLQDFMDVCKKYPDAQPFSYTTKESMLFALLSGSSSSYLNYAEGTCNFDNDDFKKVLEFCNQFPEDIDYSNVDIDPDAYSKHEILFLDRTLWGVDDYMMYYSMYGESVKIMGYPNAKGNNGIALSSEGSYGISAKTKYKEAIFEFLEVLLEDEVDQFTYNSGISPRKSLLEKQFERAMEEEYVLDENGEKIVDENGEYIRIPKMTIGTETGMYEIYSASKEDIDQIRDAIERIDYLNSEDYDLYMMIYEEAQPYFKGQKSVDETAKVIQSRMSMYISEHY